MLSLCTLFLAAIAGTSAVNYVSEVLFIMDPQVVRNYQNLGYDLATAKRTIKGDFEFFLSQINKLYDTLTVNVQIRSKHLLFLDEEIFTSCMLVGDHKLQADFALEKLVDWLKRKSYHKQYNPDVTLIYTGYDIYKDMGDYSLAGYAQTPGVCKKDGLGVAIAEFVGTQNNIEVTAHELAHTLGAKHDTILCPSYLGYVMSPSNSFKNANRWSFSPCSSRYILNQTKTLTKENNNCLTATSAPAPNFHISSQKGRDVLDVNKICQRSLRTKKTSVCRSSHFYNNAAPHGDIVCQRIYCRKPGTNYCLTAVTTEGTICDPGKRCSRGKCVAAPAGLPVPSNVVSSCLWGDGEIDGQACSTYVANNGARSCVSDTVSSTCCKTCKSKETGLPNCKYGDKASQCSTYTASQICTSSNNINVCCYTCRNYVGKRSVEQNSSIIILPDPIEEEELVEFVDNNSSNVMTGY